MKRFFFIATTALLLLSLFADMTLHAQVKAVEKLIAQGKYNDAYQKLYFKYLDNPYDLETLVMLSKFYALPDNKMKNFRLSYAFIKEAEEAFRVAVENKSGRKILKWKKKNIDFPTLKEYEQIFADSALTEAITVNSEDSYSDIITFFSSHRNVTKAASELRSKKAFDDAKKINTIQAYDNFITQYPFSYEMQEASILKAQLLYKQALQEESATELAKYMQSSDNRQLHLFINAKINRFAYEKALKENTSAALYHFLINYPASDNSKEALELYDSLFYKEQTYSQTPEEYLNFVKNHPESPYYYKAMDSLVAKIWREKDINYINKYLKLFPLDEHYPSLYKDFYNWYTVDGEKKSILEFQKQHPDFLYSFLISDDLEKASLLDQVNLLEPFQEKNYQEYLSLARKFMGKDMCYVLMQRTLESYLFSKNYTAALSRIQNFELCFEEDTNYRKLITLLSSRSNHTGFSEKIFSGYKERNHPLLVADGEVLYLSETDNGIANIYKCFRTRSGFTQPEKLKTINTSNKNEYPFWVDNDETKMLFGRDGNIFLAENIKGNWIEKGALPYPVNTEFYETDATFTPDGSGILFASDRKNGKNFQQSKAYFHGDTLPALDIYYSKKTAEGWDTPVYLGEQINSRYCEKSPILAPDMQTLFFCSDANNSLGRLDIMFAKKLNDSSWTNWSEPKSMGLFINSPEQESSVTYSLADNNIYYTSGGLKNPNNIYKAKLTKDIDNKIFNIDIKLADSSIRALPFHLILIDVSDSIILSEKLGSLNTPTSFKVAEGKTYCVFASKKGYLSTFALIPKNAPFRSQYTLKFYRLENLKNSNTSIPLHSITFNLEGEIESNSFYELELITQQLKNTTYKAEICINFFLQSEQSFILASKKANALRNFFIEKGLHSQNVIISIHPVREKKKDNTIFLKIL